MAEFTNNIYNQEIKERFLNIIDLKQYPYRWWERVFEKSYLFEKLKNKDLYNFTVPEIKEFYKFLDIGTITPLIVYNTNLLKYAQWALNENLIPDGQNHFDELDTEALNECLNYTKITQSILSYEKFMELINTKIKNEQDKFIFFCLFEGIKGSDYQDISNLKMSDINEKGNIVHLFSGKDVYVSQDFINICKAADAQTEYMGLTDGNHEMKLIPGEYIYKEKFNSSKPNREKMGQSIYKTIIRNIDYIYELSSTITAKSIRDSGLIYYLKKRAKKLNISVEELMYDKDNWADIADKYQFNVSTKKRWMMQYKEILK